jgi:flagellar biosynthetic protein FliQ
MTPEYAAEILKSLMYQAVLLAAPVLLTGMVIGLGVSLFQTITSINEQTLTFVPKALAVVALLVVILPWLLRTIIGFSISIIEKIPEMVR